MDGAFVPYYKNEDFIKFYSRVPKFRYDTFKYCWDYFLEKNFKTIVEMGTSRSFVDGKFPGCNSYGKAKYSIPYLQENGFSIIMDEYQIVMEKVK